MTEELDQQKVAVIYRKYEELAGDPITVGQTLDQLIHAAMRGVLVQALRRNRGNQCKTARELGIHRNTVSRNVQLLGLQAHVRSYVTFRKNR